MYVFRTLTMNVEYCRQKRKLKKMRLSSHNTAVNYRTVKKEKTNKNSCESITSKENNNNNRKEKNLILDSFSL